MPPNNALTDEETVRLTAEANKPELTKVERIQIGEILSRRANEIAGFSDDYRNKPDHYGSVELALTREINRLRRLEARVNPPGPYEDDNE